MTNQSFFYFLVLTKWHLTEHCLNSTWCTLSFIALERNCVWRESVPGFASTGFCLAPWQWTFLVNSFFEVHQYNSDLRLNHLARLAWIGLVIVWNSQEILFDAAKTLKFLLVSWKFDRIGKEVVRMATYHMKRDRNDFQETYCLQFCSNRWSRTANSKVFVYLGGRTW